MLSNIFYITLSRKQKEIMTNVEKRKAENKADLALCKLQDIFYLHATERIATRLSNACDAVRELLLEIEGTETKRK